MVEINSSTSIQHLRETRPSVQLRDKKSAGLRILSPAVTVGLLITCVFLLRLPSALVPRELNVDESHLLSQAMKFVNDPRPWIAADTTSSGPLNSYLIAVCLWMGFKAGFVLVHILANILVSLQVAIAYFTLRRLAPQKAALLGTLLIVIFYGVAVDTDYLQYASELLPSLLLMLGFYFLVIWLDDPGERREGVQLALLFSCGLTLGAAPWCKLQAAPISGALCLTAVAAVLSSRGPILSFSARAKALVALCVGAALTSCIMVLVLLDTHAVGEFWRSYIQGNLAQAGSFSLLAIIVHVYLVVLITPIHQFVLVGSLGVLLHEFDTINTPLHFNQRTWIAISLWAYAGAGLLAVCRAKYFFPHYAILLIAPTAYAATVFACGGITKGRVSMRWPHRPESWLAVAIVFAALCTYMAYVVRYARMIKVFHQLSQSQLEGQPGSLQTKWPLAGRGPGIERFLSLCIGPPLVISNSNDRIAGAITEIEKTHPVRSLAIWGWAPGVYVLTGIPPATRDSVGHFVISPGPMQKYFRARFLGDLRKKPPDLFIDTVATDAFKWPDWTAADGYDSDPALRSFINDNYVLVYELKSKNGAKPVRLFARKAPYS